jgi:hypothetical protein
MNPKAERLRRDGVKSRSKTSMAVDSEAAMAVALFVSIASIAWSAAFAWSRWLARPQPAPQVTGTDHEDLVEQRLADIEHAVQAIAIEVERLGEGQRFTTRVLTERLPTGTTMPKSLEADTRRVDTPH